MTIKARTGLQPEWYIPVGQKDAKDSQARFKLRPMTSPEFMDLRANYLPETRRITGRGSLQALTACMLDWEGVTDAEGQPLRFSQEAIELLPPMLLFELVNRLVLISQLREPERKN